MSNRQFTNTSTNMVQVVTSIIESYRMGSYRALAQEPVQNALDAVRKGKKKVEVEYRLLRKTTGSGENCYVLAVTDQGTTGLRGPLVSMDELEKRNYSLKPEENWAAFEAQGYTKENENALGSRGQGKSAFLYHSHVPGDIRRMLMLYDTLLKDGEYRLGMRFARPVDQRREPPLSGEEAKRILRSSTYSVYGVDIPLGLQPLAEIGTRVIVPFVNDEDAHNFLPGGELSRWLQRCWWRAIQLDKLSICIVNDETGETENIAVPNWWKALPRHKGRPSSEGSWLALSDGGRACIWGELPIANLGTIRRLVLLHSDRLNEDEIIKDHPEFAGIQILRGSQWIETRGARQDLGDYIPLGKRPGFRGYVEFDKHTDVMLRAGENSQHDGFDARGKKGEIVRELRAKLDACTREFSAELGWESAITITTQQLSKREKSTHAHFVETFLNPNGRKPVASAGAGNNEGNGLIWDCRLDLDYPNPASARVDWGQSLSNVYVEVSVEPSEELVGSADLILEWIDGQGNTQEIFRSVDAIGRQWGKDRIQKQFELGDWQVLSGKANQAQQIHNPLPGACRLRALVVYRGGRVKSAARSVWVQAEPPPPPEKNPVTLSISAVNISTKDKKRIDHGEVLQLQINARNRTPESGVFRLTATLESEILAGDLPVELPGTPVGDSPIRQPILTEKLQLLDPHQSIPLAIGETKQLTLPESSGKHIIRTELANENGDVIAASCPVYFQRDPSNARNNLPFEIEQQDQRAMWLMNADLDRLTYPANYPLYTEMKDVQRQRRALQGQLAFIAEISANGLLEWAMRPKEHGNDSHYDQLYDENLSTDDSLWDAFNRGLEKLDKMSESPTGYARVWRETVAIMLTIFEKGSD